MSIRESTHSNEYIVLREVRPDDTQAPTAMEALGPTGKSLVNDFGERVVPPDGFDYRTPVSANKRGETSTTITSTVGIYTNEVKVSDRTHGAYEWKTTIADGSPFSLSWLVNGRDADSGTGAGFQPVEYMFERHNTATQAFHNPTRDGNTAIAATPYAPNYLFRVHGSIPIHFATTSTSFETCVAPADFASSVSAEASQHGENTVDRSAYWWLWRINQKLELNWGGRPTVHRHTYWIYAPKGWGPASDPTVLGRACSHCIKPLQFNEARFYDLTTMAYYTAAGFAPTPGVNKFRFWQANRDYLVDDNGVQDGSIPPTITTRPSQASVYMASMVVDTVNDFAIAVATKFSDDLRVGVDSGQSLSLEGYATFLQIQSFVGASATGSIVEPWAILMDPQTKSNRRRLGWVGVVEYICVGRTADVVAALSDLYTSGVLDEAPTTNLPAASTAGTAWPQPTYDDRRPSLRSVHTAEWAVYDAVFPVPGEAATKLVLRPEYADRRVVAEDGAVFTPPAEVVYPAVAAGEYDRLVDVTHSVDGYTNRVRLGARAHGALWWETEMPNGYRVWHLGPTLYPTGSANQLNDAFIERALDHDAFWSNPTQMGAGLSGPPFTGEVYFVGNDGHTPQPGVERRQLFSAPLYFKVDGNKWACATRPLDFQGFGVGPNFAEDGYMTAFRGGSDTSPSLFYASAMYEEGELHWRGMKTVHMRRWWSYHPRAWGGDDDGSGDTGTTFCWKSVLGAYRGHYFDRGTVIDLAKGTTAGAFELENFTAPDATRWFISWGFTMRRGFLVGKDPAFPTVSLALPRSPYIAVVATNTESGFTKAWACKFQDTDAGEDPFISSEIGRINYIELFHFHDQYAVDDDSQLTESFNSLSFQVQCKAYRRQAGWLGYQYFELLGTREDVLADLDELMRLGDLDLTMDQPLPAEVIGDTRFMIEESPVTAICNLALTHVGDAGAVTSIVPPDGSQQSILCARHYPYARDAMLTSKQWSFATKRVALTAVESDRAEYAYAYRVPNDMLKVLAVGPPDADDDYFMAIASDPNVIPVKFTVELSDTDLLTIYTDQADAVIRYTKRVTDADLFSAQFKIALSYKLAAMLAGAIVKGEEGAALAERMERRALFEAGAAAVSDNDQEQIAPKQTYRPSWITKRNG